MINGNRYSFTSISLDANTVDGGTISLPKGVIQSINWSSKQDPGIVDGNQIVQVGRTTGYGRATGDFEILISEADNFNSSLTGSGAFPLMSIDFDWVVAYSVNDVDVRTSTLRGCRISAADVSNAKGSEATVMKYQMTIAQVLENGIAMFADPAA
jgi:hypothetical protein